MRTIVVVIAIIMFAGTCKAQIKTPKDYVRYNDSISFISYNDMIKRDSYSYHKVNKVYQVYHINSFGQEQMVSMETSKRGCEKFIDLMINQAAFDRKRILSKYPEWGRD